MTSTLEVKDRALVDEAVSTGAAAALRECAQPSKGVVSKEEEVGQALREGAGVHTVHATRQCLPANDGGTACGHGEPPLLHGDVIRRAEASKQG